MRLLAVALVCASAAAVCIAGPQRPKLTCEKLPGTHAPTLCVRSDPSTGEAEWYLERHGKKRKISGPSTSLAYVAEMSASPTGSYLAVISVGEGHPMVDVFDLGEIREDGKAEPLVTFNPYPGTISVERWESDTLILSSDAQLTAKPTEGSMPMLPSAVEFAVAMPGATVTERGPAAATIEGVVVEKPWTKSEESWNAGGSEYYVLDRGRGEQVYLKPSASVPIEALAKWKGKRAKVVGHFVEGDEYVPASPTEQHPVSPLPSKRGSGFEVVSISSTNHANEHE